MGSLSYMLSIIVNTNNFIYESFVRKLFRWFQELSQLPSSNAFKINQYYVHTCHKNNLKDKIWKII